MEGEGRLLARLVRNLLDNAARHAPGSPALVEVEVHGGRAVLRVSDRGPGVLEAERERIFEPFYRRPGTPTDKDGRDPKGVGLGLSLVRQIARRHGGEATCQPRHGGGASFEVSLPVREA